MDKSWITKDILSKEYEEGVDGFIKLALENTTDPSRVHCHCRKCSNLKKLDIMEIKSHLYFNGMDQTYVKWIWHGEEYDSNYNVPSERKQFDQVFDDPIEMVRDIDERFVDKPEEILKFLEDAEKPIFSGAPLSKLVVLVKLYNLKAGMEYSKIHACPNDCILYRNQNESATECPICKTSRWKKNKNNKECKKGIPAKVLLYLPPIPRFIRFFRNPEHVESLRWHEDGRIKDDKLRHPADSPAWKEVDELWPQIREDPRNLRLGLSTDGINPFSNMSSSYSCWPVILCIYNLPPLLCMKRRFTMLTLLISGPKQHGNDIDIYLAPLIDDLKVLWNGIDCYDSFKEENFILRSVLLWTINDFPAYGNLSGCFVKGYKECPICGEQTSATRLEHCRKMCYMGHRRFLLEKHYYRKQKLAFNGEQELREAPTPMTGEAIYEEIRFVENKFGKPVENVDENVETGEKERQM
ncbi:uncharacterized protein LOC133814303 [Humulus lupulus]|uniref:uncharacterized protein LOC133814303 n=1 Tax=Humulus lupulus TaxID=3486 RepID=UPI002B4062D7|nr:uncharacterized protein LOC133814303 [Humulus lupulus]